MYFAKIIAIQFFLSHIFTNLTTNLHLSVRDGEKLKETEHTEEESGIMKQSERASITRVITDLIEADGIIDTREIIFLETLRKKYGIKKEDEILASSYTLSMALSELSDSDDGLRQDLVGDFLSLSMSDDFCAREEALLILALQSCLTKKSDCQASVLSINASNLNFEDSQIIYVESEYDDDINKQIKEHYREICSEIHLSGFDFVYLPQMSEHYKSISEANLLYIAEFLYPNVSRDRLLHITNQLRNLSTQRFCKDQLATKLNVKEIETVSPSFMMKIGTSLVNDQQIDNFLLLEIDKDVVKCIRDFLDMFSEKYQNFQLNYLKDGKGRFVFKGFYKQMIIVFFGLMLLMIYLKQSVDYQSKLRQ